MSTANFADRVHDAMQRKQSRLIVGLDPVWDSLPHTLRDSALAQYEMEGVSFQARAWALREFCEKIIEATAPLAVAFKPQLAFFERYGSIGIEVLERILEEHEDLLFILDGKRGDIGSTSEAYAQSYFSHAGEPMAPLPASAVTLNAYLGRDAIAPFEAYFADGKGAFALVKTSNPSSADFQDQLLDGEPFFLHVAKTVAAWGEDHLGNCGYSALGMVVGATFPDAALQVRAVAPRSLFLVPGIGVQGGKPDDAPAFCSSDGLGALFNFSRGVIYAYKSELFKHEYADQDYARAARAAAEHYRLRLNEAIGQF